MNMKVFAIVLEVVAALAVIAGVVFVIVRYGEKILAWCKRVLKMDAPFRVCDDDEACTCAPEDVDEEAEQDFVEVEE